jgi:hypothetical protein
VVATTGLAAGHASQRSDQKGGQLTEAQAFGFTILAIALVIVLCAGWIAPIERK